MFTTDQITRFYIVDTISSMWGPLFSAYVAKTTGWLCFATHDDDKYGDIVAQLDKEDCISIGQKL